MKGSSTLATLVFAVAVVTCMPTGPTIQGDFDDLKVIERRFQAGGEVNSDIESGLGDGFQAEGRSELQAGNDRLRVKGKPRPVAICDPNPAPTITTMGSSESASAVDDSSDATASSGAVSTADDSYNATASSGAVSTPDDSYNATDSSGAVSTPDDSYNATDSSGSASTADDSYDATDAVQKRATLPSQSCPRGYEYWQSTCKGSHEIKTQCRQRNTRSVRTKTIRKRCSGSEACVQRTQSNGRSHASCPDTASVVG